MNNTRTQRTEADDSDNEVYAPGEMLAEVLCAHRDKAIHDHITESAWGLLRRFCRKYDVDLNADTAFSELDAIPSLVFDAAGQDAPTLDVVQAFLHDSPDPLPDPQKVIAGLKVERAKRWAEHNHAARELTPRGILPTTEFTLSEVARVTGDKVADAARQWIERRNRDVWNMGPAARKYHREEHNYLVTAVELVGPLFAVSADHVAQMTAATPSERSAAWADLADARSAHRIGVVDHNPVSGRWCTLDDLDNLPAPGWLVDKLVPAGLFTRLIGMSQSLKSFIALDMALSVATGTPFAGLDRFATAEPRHVIYVVGEGAQGINKRVSAWCSQRRINRTKVRKNLTLLAGAAQLGSRRDMAEVRAKVEETDAKLIIFDTQARCTVGLEENSASEAGRAIAALDELIQTAGVAVLLLHHTTKADPRNARGSGAWHNAVDAELVAVRDGEKLEVSLEVTKMKDDTVLTCPLKATKVTVAGGESLVIGPGSDPTTVDPNAPIDEWTGKGSAYAQPMYALAQEHCIRGEGLTQTRLADIASEVVSTERTATGIKKVRRVCSKGPATAAVKLLVDHGWLIEAKRDYLGHVFYQPKGYPPPDVMAASSLPSTDAAIIELPVAPASV